MIDASPRLRNRLVNMASSFVDGLWFVLLGVR
jgi:hypothetical protein